MAAEACAYFEDDEDSWYVEQEQAWKSKQIKLDQVASKIPNGSKVYIGSTAATPEATLTAMVQDWGLADIQILQIIPGGTLPHQQEGMDRFRTNAFMSYQNTGYFQPEQMSGTEGLKDYTPIPVSEIHRLLEEGKLEVDVTIIMVTPPHKGFVSLGIGVEDTMDFIRHSKVVIAEVNEHMPWTEGPSKVETSKIDFWMDLSKPLRTAAELWPAYFNIPGWSKDIQEKIGKNVSKQISDGATLRFGVSANVYSVLPHLHGHKDLGLHTDYLTDPMVKLHKQGVITNAKKTIHRGRSIVCQAVGSQKVYAFCDRNPVVEFHPAKYVTNAQTLAQIDNLVAVIGALKVDVTGQVATDSIAHKVYGGVFSDSDSIHGARFSKGGKPIIVLPSLSLHGRSNILFDLPLATGVSITRSDVEYVITEFGTAYLYGKSIRERCLALIDIAHPRFRPQLLQQAKDKRYISQSQPGNFSSSLYPSELECVHKTKSNKKVLVRPIKPVDEELLRSFFHKLSDPSTYIRYFQKLGSTPQLILQKAADIDYANDMALLALSPPDSPQQEIVGLTNWVSSPSGIPDIGLQVLEDWRSEGLGSYLLKRLATIAKKSGLSKLQADVLTDGKSIGAIHGLVIVLEKCGLDYTKQVDFGVATYTVDLTKWPTGEE